jgi:hypothetical protein
MPTVTSALAHFPELESFTVASRVASVASPLWMGVEHDGAVASNGRDQLFVRALHDEKLDLIPASDALDAAQRAGCLGVAPHVVVADPRFGAAVFEALPSWRPAMMANLSSPDCLARVVRAQEVLHASEPLQFARSVFEEVELLHRVAQDESAFLPADIDALLDAVRVGAQAVQSTDRPSVPCHRDTIAGNVLLSDGQVRLCDFDRAGNDDPLFDLAVLLSDTFLLEDEWLTALEALGWSPDPDTLALLHLYAAADDVATAIRAQVYAVRSRHRGLEYAKYAGWRFLKARWAVYDRRYELWVRTLT